MSFLNFGGSRGGSGGEADTEGKAGGLVRRVLVKNTGLKILALAFAVALWFLVVGEKESELGLLVPLGFKGIPEDMLMVGEPPKDIEVRVAGPKVFIGQLSPSEVSAAVDLSDAVDGRNTLRIEAGDIKTPRGIVVVKVRPPSVDIKLERLLRMVVPVRVRVKGKPAEGFEVVKVTTMPEGVEVLGRSKDVKLLKTIYTAEIDVSGLEIFGGEEVLLDISDKGITGVEPDTVLVMIEIVKKVKKGKAKR